LTVSLRKEPGIDDGTALASSLQVHWLKEGRLLRQTDTVRMTHRGDRHTLILSSIRSGLDFGNYSCVAENNLGTFK